jgi:hypothetical protein
MTKSFGKEVRSGTRTKAKPHAKIHETDLTTDTAEASGKYCEMHGAALYDPYSQHIFISLFAHGIILMTCPLSLHGSL